MSCRSCARGRPATYTALLLTLVLSVLLTGLLPAGAAQAGERTGTTAATAATAGAATATAAGAAASGAEDCAEIPPAPFGDPGAAEKRVTVPGDGSVCLTFTAEAPGMHRVLVDPNRQAYVTVLDGEEPVECHDPAWGAGWCDLPRAGAFTLNVVNGEWDAREIPVTVTPLATTEGCAEETGTSYDLPPVIGTSASEVGLVCHPFSAEPGDRITVDFRTTAYGEAGSWITDESGAHICPSSNGDGGKGCVLPGDGPYRVLGWVSYAERGFPAEYSLKVRRLSDPAGCADVPVNPYGSAPTEVEPSTGCKTFTAPAAGRYGVYEVASTTRASLAVFDRAGRTVCETWESPCSLPEAGDYTVLTGHSTLIVDRAGSEGCEPAGLGTRAGEFTAAGEIDCLTLPLPEGARAAALTPLHTGGPEPDLTVLDADGAQRCSDDDLGDGSCALTGAAPFRLLVSTDDDEPATGGYRVALHRTDTVSDCPVLPAGSFGSDTAEARFTMGGGVFSHCLSIPADDHSAAEILQLETVSGGSTAQFTVVDAEGRQSCYVNPSRSTWTTCRLTPGLAHTVLVSGRDHEGEYRLVRRDVTATAEGCAATPATAVGGPSTGGTPAAPGQLRCHQVTTAAAGDTLHLDVRDPLGTANILAFDGDGTSACSHRNRACAVSGSTHYQVLVTVPSTLKAAESYRFDALRIGTPDGPAEECADVPSIAYGYGPVTGTLDEQHTAVCAALPTAYADRFDFVVSDTAGGTRTAVPALYDASRDNGCTLYVPTGYRCAVSEPYSREVSPSVLVVGLPEDASRTEYRAELVCSSTICGTEKVGVGTVAPLTGVSGSRTEVTVTGTALHEDDKVRISRSGKQVESTGTEVAADRRSMTAALDLTGLEPGAWSLSVITHNGWEYAKGSFTVDPAPLENTAPPVVTGAARVGAKLTATTGSWTPAADSYTYRWTADGQAVEGATSSTFTVPASLRGKKVGVSVTAVRSGSRSTTAQSAARTVVAAFRDHAGTGAVPDGVGDLLTLNSSGGLTFQQGSAGTGAFSGKTSASGWPTSVKAVPFGDVDADGCNDVLVRMSDGSLRSYRPACGKALAPSTPYVSLGTGWNQYDLLTSPGDVSGDGRADLIARHSSTKAVYLYKGTSGGKLSSRVKLYDKWTYKKILGAGDLDGDGHGDLLAQDSANDLWRYHGTGGGKFASRVKVFDAWGSTYNAVVGVGDITGDGRADLVVRDTSGNLYRNNGNGKGSFSGRVKIVTGWQGYKALF
ncbi:FG-GAP-like repeat-containing protein [Streptomyces sp. MJP52]|uniref:FG-GAP-like repeat-containing protein n=1 Tax=Streptomyces sp. MJP52 TaxID=2940555 RepID=UPI002474E5CD|nr:FG-GAP-like repeat-containing protein [Streptomyces sp. MJP52]MDH6224284.1 hypothetical protein [Streptomyces sp. MJP52]